MSDCSIHERAEEACKAAHKSSPAEELGRASLRDHRRQKRTSDRKGADSSAGEERLEQNKSTEHGNQSEAKTNQSAHESRATAATGLKVLHTAKLTSMFGWDLHHTQRLHFQGLVRAELPQVTEK